jgi:3-deoxy-manno-octulosonate cytidylyltransferase (CMP-KDO synthetase)
VAKSLDAEIVVNIQGDEPLVNPEMIDETVQALIDEEQIEVSTPVKKIASSEELSSPSIVKAVLDENKCALYFSRAVIPFLQMMQDRRDWVEQYEFYKHIGLYVFRKKFLLMFTQWDRSPLEQAERLEQLRILEHGYRIKCVITEHDAFSIDTPEDLEFLTKRMRS